MLYLAERKHKYGLSVFYKEIQSIVVLKNSFLLYLSLRVRNVLRDYNSVSFQFY